ncbi:hypothetical protein BC829DRAFT_457499, partial [Chytridium lagenaria]
PITTTTATTATIVPSQQQSSNPTPPTSNHASPNIPGNNHLHNVHVNGFLHQNMPHLGNPQSFPISPNGSEFSEGGLPNLSPHSATTDLSHISPHIPGLTDTQFVTYQQQRPMGGGMALRQPAPSVFNYPTTSQPMSAPVSRKRDISSTFDTNMSNMNAMNAMDSLVSDMKRKKVSASYNDGYTTPTLPSPAGTPIMSNLAPPPQYTSWGPPPPPQPPSLSSTVSSLAVVMGQAPMDQQQPLRKWSQSSNSVP